MSQVQKALPRIVSSIEARHILGIHQSTFTRLVRAGVFRRIGGGFEAATLLRNHFRAIEIEAKAQARIDMIRAETRRELSALGTEDLDHQEVEVAFNPLASASLLNSPEAQ